MENTKGRMSSKDTVLMCSIRLQSSEGERNQNRAGQYMKDTDREFTKPSTDLRKDNEPQDK